jgi:hypothetical protein
VSRWLVAPTPALEKFTFPGFAFAYAINSFTSFAGTLGCTTRMCATDATLATGAKSRAGS